ncbi:MAG TPA: phosphotransferase [Sphingobium sp.]
MTRATAPVLPIPALLERVEDIVPAWMDAVLRGAGVAAPPLRAVRAEPVGHGTTSVVCRLHLDYAGKGAGARAISPATLIAKFPRGKQDGLAVDPVVAGFAREVAAYRHFGAAAPCRIPRCYLAAVDDRGVFNLILEDLDAGCCPGDQIAGCSIAEGMAVVHELAGLHAAWWEAPALSTLDWPRDRTSAAAQHARLYRRGAAVMQERFGDRLDAQALRIIGDAAELVERFYATPPAVRSLIHTDPRVDNIIFEGEGEALRACLIDLQSMAVGDPANDLAYFLTGSLSPTDRAACERDAVEVHAARLRGAGIAQDSADAWERYCQYAMAGLTGTVAAAGVVQQGEHVDRLLMTLVRRNCAAVAALDGLAAAERRIAHGADF